MQNEPRRDSSTAWRTQPAPADKARPGLPPPKSAFSIFLAPSSANALEVARLLAEISKLQCMLGGQGIEYRLAGVRHQPPSESPKTTAKEHNPRDASGIVRWEALPMPRAGRRLSRRDLLTMEIIGRFLGAKTIQVDALGDDFIRGHSAPDAHPAQRLALEATNFVPELSSQPPAESESTIRSPMPWLEQLAEIEKIDSNAQRFLAIAKLFEQNDALAAKLAGILETIQLLRSFTGAQVEIETVDRKDAAIDLDKPYFTPLEIDLSDD